VDGTLMWRYNIKLLKASPPQIKASKLYSFDLDNANSNHKKEIKKKKKKIMLTALF